MEWSSGPRTPALHFKFTILFFFQFLPRDRNFQGGHPNDSPPPEGSTPPDEKSPIDDLDENDGVRKMFLIVQQSPQQNFNQFRILKFLALSTVIGPTFLDNPRSVFFLFSIFLEEKSKKMSRKRSKMDCKWSKDHFWLFLTIYHPSWTAFATFFSTFPPKNAKEKNTAPYFFRFLMGGSWQLMPPKKSDQALFAAF